MKIQKYLSLALTAPIFVLCLGIAATAQTYYGQGTAAWVTIEAPLVSPVSTAVADTGPLPGAGGNISLSSASTSISGVLSVGSSNVSASGSAGVSQATAIVNSVNINVLGNTISADVVSATTNCSCPLATCSGSSSITNLVVNGSSVTVTGSANQTIPLPGSVGNLVINEQISELRMTTVNTIHVFVTAVDTTTTDIIVASARSGVDCGISPPTNLYGGFGRSVNMIQVLGLPPAYLSLFIADTGWLPRTGGVINTSTTNAAVGTLVTTSAATSSTSGGVPGGNVNTTQSSSHVDQLGINALSGAVVIGATVLQSDTQCSCSTGAPSCAGSSSITNLSVQIFGSNVPVTITGAPNQVVTIPVAGLGKVTLTINEQISSDINEITVNALRVELNLTGLAETTITISAAHSDLSCAIGVTAGEVSLSGRVFDSVGNGLYRATVNAIGSDGVSHRAMTNSFGYFRIDGLTAGASYVVSVRDRRYTFTPRVVNLADDLADFNFAPLDNSFSKAGDSLTTSSVITGSPAFPKKSAVITSRTKKNR